MRPQGIGIIMIASGNHTIMQLGSNEYRRTVHAFAAGRARNPLPMATRHRYRAGQGSHEYRRTVHAFAAGRARPLAAA